MMSQSFTPHSLTAQPVTVLAQQQQIQAAPGAGTAGALLATAACIAAVIYFKKHKGANVVHLVMAFVCGVLLAGTVFGTMASSLANSVGSSAVTMLGNVGVTKG